MKYPLILFAILISGCSQEWKGFVYPNKNDLTKHIELGTFDSLVKCRDSALNLMSKLGDRTKQDYECGLNCRPMKNYDGTYDISICEKTER